MEQFKAGEHTIERILESFGQKSCKQSDGKAYIKSDMVRTESDTFT